MQTLIDGSTASLTSSNPARRRRTAVLGQFPFLLLTHQPTRRPVQDVQLTRDCTIDRPALSELMKTPGRKRTVGANATNHAAAGHSLASAKKDPLATLLFADAGSARAHSPHDKENSTFSATGSGTGTRTSPRKLLSPLAAAATASSRTGKPAASPIRLSPRPALATASKEKTKAQSAPVPEPAPAQEPVVEVASVEPEQPTRPVAEPPVQEEPEPTTIVLDVVEEEVKADLSIIGEEEEEDAAEVASSFRASEAATSLVTETQLSQPIANTSAQLPPRSVLSPPRNVSNASSVAPEADAEEDHTVPLNDAPSTLRSADLSSSLSASTTRTPGSSTSRFTLGTYSAGKLGGLGIGSSPPPAGTAPATAGGRLANPRISSGGPAPRQLNFVGLPKKSLGHGLGLGRGWNNQSGSNVGDSQSSTGTSNKSVTLSDSAPATDVEVEQATTVTASGSTKRKSITGPDLANKTPKLAEPALTEQELKRKRYEELNNRMQSLQARQSVLGGRASNVAGPFGANAIFGANKPFGGSSSSLFQSTAPLASAKTTVGATQSTAVPASAPAPEAPQAANARRPSVMERVRSFESNTTGAESMHPPSPSKIPSALAANSHHVARPTSPPLSPRRLASPGPASPRLMGRSATFALPLASFGSPRSAQSTTASPRVAALSRSPTAQASMSISSMLESAPKAPVAKLQSPSKSPVRPDITATATRSSTPVGSPRALNLQVNRAEAKAREQVDAESRAPEMPVAEKVVHEEEGEEEEEEDEPTMSIRAVNASVDPATVAAAEAKKRAEADAAAEAERVRDDREAAARRAAEQAARALEEQEAQREREELLKKRLPSLPEPKAPTDDEASSSDEEREDQATKVAPSAPPPKGMPGSFAAEDAADDMEQDDDDLTSMSVMSTATASSTLNLTQHQPFKPVVAHKATGVQKHAAKSSIASSVSTTSTLSRSVSNNALATSISKKPKIEVNAVKRAAAAAKKVRKSSSASRGMRLWLLTSFARPSLQEKEERERQAALREEKRAALLKRKQEEERKAKVEGLEKKRKEREEAATKATKGSVIRGVKPKVRPSLLVIQNPASLPFNLCVAADRRRTGEEAQDRTGCALGATVARRVSGSCGRYGPTALGTQQVRRRLFGAEQVDWRDGHDRPQLHVEQDQPRRRRSYRATSSARPECIKASRPDEWQCSTPARRSRATATSSRAGARTRGVSRVARHRFGVLGLGRRSRARAEAGGAARMGQVSEPGSRAAAAAGDQPGRHFWAHPEALDRRFVTFRSRLYFASSEQAADMLHLCRNVPQRE